jgi:hypothetical protein
MTLQNHSWAYIWRSQVNIQERYIHISIYLYIYKEDVTHTHTTCARVGVLVTHKEEQNYVVSRKMNGTGYHHIEQDKPSSKGQILHIFHAYTESRPKMVIKVIIMGHENKRSKWTGEERGGKEIT